VYTKRHLTWANVVLAGLTTTLLTFGIWHRFDPRAIVLFVGGLIVAEVFVQLRWRMGVSCPYCNFDPVLYRKSADKAAEKVLQFYDKRKEDADFYLTSTALIETQRRMQEVARRKRRDSPGASVTPDRLVSKNP